MAEDSIKGRFVGFLFTSVLAGLVTTTFTYKSWREQTRLDLAKSQLAEATKTFDRASQLMSGRVFYSYRVSHAIDGDDEAAFMAKMDKLDKAVEDWNLAYADLLQDFQFALEIDDHGQPLPYREIRTADFEETLRCEHAFDDSNGPKYVDWNRASWLLAALHHCFIVARVKPIAWSLRVKPAPTPSAPGKKPLEAKIVDSRISQKTIPADAPGNPVERRKKLDALESSIDELKTHAEEVRVAGKKAIQRLRNATETRGFLEFLRSW